MAEAGGRRRIAAAFAAARGEGRAALMPYMMGGFPDRETSAAVAEAYADAGADLIELGVPFSDPLADGPVIHAAATSALAAGATLDNVLEDCAAVAGRVPWCAMVYANMVLARGPERFAGRSPTPAPPGRSSPTCRSRRAPRSGARCEAAGLALVPLVAPTTPPERRRQICAAARGFVYVVSDHRHDRRARPAAGRARRTSSPRTQGRRGGPGRGRVRGRDSRAGGAGRARSPTA